MASPVGFAAMGGVMRAADPGREVRGLLSVVAQACDYIANLILTT